MADLNELINSFFRQVGTGHVEIYNEFSVQHELGIHLRSRLGDDFKVQFERPVSYFGIDRAKTRKKEIDIAIFTPDRRIKHAIELKFPRSGQHPEQMFKACEDICFVEQLVQNGFTSGVFVMVADDPLFYSGPSAPGIYGHFRSGQPVCGIIQKPTGARDDRVAIKGSHRIAWLPIAKRLQFALVNVMPALTSMENNRV